MRESLESYAAGRLPGAEASRLEAHLRQCPDCSRELQWVRVLKAGVRKAPRPAMPPDLRAELLRLARAASLSRSGERPPGKGGVPWHAAWRWAAGFGFASAFAAAAILVIGRSPAAEETLSLDEVLEAHSSYEMTMPAADRESLITNLSLRLSQEGGRHD
ncbi:MAG: anti-sigma factor [Elusimicrobia bacterium]|nr:anti-sigma factor [Elusimicrobiota bacterium]